MVGEGTLFFVYIVTSSSLFGKSKYGDLFAKEVLYILFVARSSGLL